MKSCPFCKGTARLHVRQIRFIGQNYYGNKKIRTGAQVVCNCCKARGPLFTGDVVDPWSRLHVDPVLTWLKDEAIKAWNRRVDDGARNLR